MTSFDDGSSRGEFFDAAGLLSPQESLDDDELGGYRDEGYSPAERPWGISA